MKQKQIRFWLTVLMLTWGISVCIFPGEPVKNGRTEMSEVLPNTMNEDLRGAAGEQGVKGGVHPRTMDEDLLQAPIKVIHTEVRALEIKPTETIELGVEGGEDSLSGVGTSGESYLQFGSSRKSSLKYQINPVIVEGEGIELRIRLWEVGGQAKEVIEKTVRTRNYESVIVEFMENQASNSRYALKITPTVRTINPPKEYPREINEVKIEHHILLMNEQLILDGGSLGADGPFFVLYTYIKGKGLYVISFKPFPGAMPCGAVNGNYIKFKVGQDVIKWVSMSPILPEGRWRVYVRYNPNYKRPPFPGHDAAEADSSYFGVSEGSNCWAEFFKDK